MEGKNRKIKVLRIIARLNIGGPAQHVVFLTEGLAKDRYDSSLVYGQLDAGEGDMSYLVRESGIRHVFIPDLVRPLSPIRDLKALCALMAIMLRERPDVVHTHTAKAGTLGRISAILTGVPIRVHTFHGHIFHGYFGKFRTAVFLACERILARFTDAIVVVSARQRDELLGSYKIGEEKKYKVINLGFEFGKYKDADKAKGSFRRLYGLKDTDIVIISVGRLVPVKNHAMLIDAAALLKEKTGPDIAGRLKFLMIGDGPDRGALEAYAAQKGCRENIIFTGWVKNVAEAYASADIVALTSRNEGTPLSLIEALAAGRPVVATNVGGVADVLDKYGFLVDSGDAVSFSARLGELIGSETLRSGMGQAGRQYVEQRFSKKNLFNNVDELYRSLVEKKGIKP